jgi:hypothetical protein
MAIADEIVISEFSCGARTDFKADELLNKDEENDFVDTTPSIEQNSTWSSSDPWVGGEGAAAF